MVHFQNFSDSSDTDNKSILEVKINPNSSINDVAKKLVKEKIIQTRLFFVFLVKFLNQIPESGEYVIHKNLSAYQILKKLKSKNSKKYKLYIPEGSTAHEVKEILLNCDWIFGEINNLEDGDILPETYVFNYGTKRDEVINYMKKEMKNFLIQAYQIYLKNINENGLILLKSPRDLMILSSIVEKESSNDQSLVAGVFLNRLQYKMRLNSCATAMYEITRGKWKFNRKLTFDDMKKIGDYNTYEVNGLPKGAICNPSKRTILNTGNFEKTKFLYFILDDKSHIFSKNFKDHLKIKFTKKTNIKNKLKNKS